MSLFLSPGFFLAVRAEDLVILDVSRGEYLLAPGAGAGLTVSPDSNEVRGASPALAQALGEIGALAALNEWAARSAPPALPTRDLGALSPTRPTARDLLCWGMACGDMLSGYWRRPFPALVAAERTAPIYPEDRDRLIACAAAFRELMPWTPFQGVCLFRSLMLRAFLRRARLSATWVIGCRTWPFEAHCWLQSGDLVLDDTADHAASFTPLMAVAG